MSLLKSKMALIIVHPNHAISLITKVSINNRSKKRSRICYYFTKKQIFSNKIQERKTISNKSLK
jgi:hypothetical protein